MPVHHCHVLSHFPNSAQGNNLQFTAARACPLSSRLFAFVFLLLRRFLLRRLFLRHFRSLLPCLFCCLFFAYRCFSSQSICNLSSGNTILEYIIPHFSPFVKGKIFSGPPPRGIPSKKAAGPLPFLCPYPIEDSASAIPAPCPYRGHKAPGRIPRSFPQPEYG